MLVILPSFPPSFSGLFIFPYLAKKFFTKKVKKIGKSIPLRVVAVINRVLIFRRLKSEAAGIFS